MDKIRTELKSLGLPISISHGLEMSDGGTLVFDRFLTADEKVTVEEFLKQQSMKISAWRGIGKTALDYVLTTNLTKVSPVARKLAKLLGDAYLLEADENILPLLSSLNMAGYRTVDYSCEGGKGHDFNVAMLVLDATTFNLEGVKQVIKKHTSIPFTIHKQGKSAKLFLPSGEETATRITPGSYVVWFTKSLG